MTRESYKLGLIDVTDDGIFDDLSLTPEEDEEGSGLRDEFDISYDENYGEYANEDMEITLIQSSNSISDHKIKSFIDFCKKKNLFDDTFYDYGNVFSAVATRLPDTFNKISGNNKEITHDKFKKIFKRRFKYTGDLSYIFNLMDNEKKGYVTWDEFKDFFLPFVKNITI